MQQTRSLQLWCALAILLLGVAIRLPHLPQSLWYDEMTTLVEYVIQPWQKMLAPKAGEYVPNNHVLHTILAKIVYSLGGPTDRLPPDEAMLRLPAFCAGLLVPFALAWPLRCSEPLVAILIALLTMINPWLVAFSTEARGYSLMLMLGIIATNCLGKRPIGYITAMSLAIYTIPLALLLLPAHLVALLVKKENATAKARRREAGREEDNSTSEPFASSHLRGRILKSRFANWFIILCLTVAASGLLYLPMIHGLLSYYRHPYLPTMDYRQFLDWLPRYAMAGIRLPHNLDPLAPPVTGAIFWVLPVLAIVFGSVMGWSRIALRPILLTLGIATILGALLPLMDPGATEVRFVPWIMPWFCVSITVGLLSAGTQWGRAAAVLGFATLIGSQIQLNINMPPNQPIREGIALADKIVPPNRDILVLYLGARESVALYGSAAPHHPLLPGPDVQSMLAMEQKSLCDTGHLPWVVIFFEAIARDRNDDGSETRGMWTHLLARYHLAAPRLDGRLTPLAIYAPKEAQKE